LTKDLYLPAAVCRPDGIGRPVPVADDPGVKRTTMNHHAIHGDSDSLPTSDPRQTPAPCGMTDGSGHPAHPRERVWRWVAGCICLLLTFSLLGCGGGGGGGGDDPLPANLVIKTDPILGVQVPNGFSSVGFPISSTQAAVPGFKSTTTCALVVANNGGSEQSVALQASLEGPVTSVRAAGAPMAAVIEAGDSPGSGAGPAGTVTDDDTDLANLPAPGALFHRYLRERERQAPDLRSVTGPVERGASDVRAAVRADTVSQVVTFQVIRFETTPTAYRSVRGICRRVVTSADAATLNLYVDETMTITAGVSTLLDQIAQGWPAIYRTVVSTFGNEPPTDFNGLGPDVTILLTTQIEYPGLAGFFNSADLYAPGQVNTGVSNQRKMFYLKYDAKYTADDLLSTVAHEFQHMVNFYQRKTRGLTEDDWLNEAMSGYAEHVCGYGMDSSYSKAGQVRRFLDLVRSTRLIAQPWPGNDAEPYVHAYYGQAYLFGTWLARQYGSSGSVRALVSGAQKGKDGVAALAGKSFDTVFAEFLVALAVNDRTAGSRYGFGDIDLKKTYVFGSRSVALTGPSTFGNAGTFPYDTRAFAVAPYAGGFVSLTGGRGNTLQLAVPSTLSTFEFHR